MRSARDFDAFRARTEAVVRRHPVVASNTYTRWFANGSATCDDVRHLTVRFSVFSHLFVEAQLRKVMNAPTLDEYPAGKEILINELREAFERPGFSERRFLQGAKEMLDGVQAFWDGLWEDRLSLRSAA